MSDYDFSEPIPPSEPHGLDPGELPARGLETGNPSAAASPWEPPTPEELGRLLPEYRIANLIGRGGRGAVYRGTQIALDRPVAVKLLPPEIAADGEFVARIYHETRALAKLQHSRIIVVHDFGQTSDGHLYIVMEYIDGTDLRRILQGPGLSPNEALHVVGQVCDALRAAHSQGVNHGGIKPENILITGEGYVKVVDFGLARPLSHEEMIAPLVAGGTATAADYLAPEQREGQAGERADIFALGVVFYEMLAGAPPRGAFEPPSSRIRGTPMDERIDGIVSMALQPEPDRRYQRVSEMKYDVDRIRKKPLPDSTPPTVPMPPVPLKKRRLTLANLAAVLLLLIAIAGFAIWAKNGRIASSRSNSGNAREAIRPANSVGGPKVIGHDSPIAQATPPTPKRSSSPTRAMASTQTAPPKATPSFALNAAAGRQEISLFNGRDLTGWAGDPGVWSVEDGAITGRAKPGTPNPEYSNLVWKGGLVSDFEITWKYKIMPASSDQPGSCGMFFRAMVINDSLFVRGYLADASTDRDITGGLRDGFRSKDLAGQNQQVIIQDGTEPGQPVIVEVGEAGNSRGIRKGVKENDWNECKAVVSGNGVQLFVNGRMTVDAVDMGALVPRWGTFALARRPPASVQFKDIRLRDMGFTPRSAHAPGVAGEKSPSPREPSALERAALEDCLTFYKWRCTYTSVPNGDPIQITFDRNGTATSQHFRCPWKITASRTVMISPNHMPVSLEFDESLTHFKGYLAGQDLRYRGEQIDASNMSIASGSETPSPVAPKVVNLDARPGGISLPGGSAPSHAAIPAPPEPAPFIPPPRPSIAQPSDLETALLSYKWAWSGIPHRHTFHTVLEFQKDGTIRLAGNSDLWHWHKIDSRRFFLEHHNSKNKSLSFVLALNEAFTSFAQDQAPGSGPSGVRQEPIASDADASPALPDGQTWVSVSGVGPSGANAGWGNARLPMHAIVSTNASTSVNLRLDCYWVVVNGSHHSVVPVAASFDRNIHCAPGEQTRIDFEDDTSFHRNNATKDGIDNPAGLFRGWVLSVHDSNGKKVGWAANIREFVHLAP